MKFQVPAGSGWFGLHPRTEDEIAGAWGARAILTGSSKNQWVDLLSNRQQALPDAPAEFIAWLKGPMMTWLEGRCGERWIDPASGDLFRLDDGVFHAIASPQRSYGYLYIGAWMEAQS